MKSRMLVELMEMFGNCPNCKNDKLGNGEGDMYMKDDTFYRKCKCGYEITMIISETVPQKK